MSLFDPDIVTSSAINAEVIKQSERNIDNTSTLSLKQLDEVLENVLSYILFRVKAGISDGIFDQHRVAIPVKVFGVEVYPFDEIDADDHPNIIYIRKKLSDLGFSSGLNQNKQELIIIWGDNEFESAARRVYSKSIGANISPVSPMSIPVGKLFWMDTTHGSLSPGKKSPTV